MNKIFKNFECLKKTCDIKLNRIANNDFTILNINDYVKENIDNLSYDKLEYLFDFYLKFYNKEIDNLHKYSYAMQKVNFDFSELFSRCVEDIFIFLSTQKYIENIIELKKVIDKIVRITNILYGNQYMEEFDEKYDLNQILKNNYYNNEEFIEMIHKIGNDTFIKIIALLTKDIGRKLSVQEAKNLLHVKSTFANLLKRVENGN